MNRTDICILIHGSHPELLPLHTTVLQRYAPDCNWPVIPETPLTQDFKYILHTHVRFLLQGRPREKVLEGLFDVLDHTPSIASVHLIPKVNNKKGWFLYHEKGSEVWIERIASSLDDSTSLHLAWAREGQHANAILLGPWPVRLDALVADLVQECVLDFAEAEGFSLRGPSLR